MDSAENMNDSTLAFLGRARAYCAADEQCSHAVRLKLRAWGADECQTDDIVERLVDEGYLDDERYARDYCESRLLRAGWGRRKAAYQLRLKRMPQSLIDAALASVDDEAYMAVLADAAAKKAATLRGADEATCRRKVASFLLQRGYTIDEINQVLININQQL